MMQGRLFVILSTHQRRSAMLSERRQYLLRQGSEDPALAPVFTIEDDVAVNVAFVVFDIHFV